jgi:hypothetical protein
MSTPLADAREAARRAREEAAEARKRAYRRTRLGFKLLVAPVVLGVAFVIYQCGYWVGWMDGVATLAR